jgi:hypothetical protein
VVVDMDTTRLTGTIVPVQVLLSGREVRDILSGVGEVRGWRSEQVILLYQTFYGGGVYTSETNGKKSGSL